MLEQCLATIDSVTYALRRPIPSERMAALAEVASTRKVRPEAAGYLADHAGNCVARVLLRSCTSVDELPCDTESLPGEVLETLIAVFTSFDGAIETERHFEEQQLVAGMHGDRHVLEIFRRHNCLELAAYYGVPAIEVSDSDLKLFMALGMKQNRAKSPEDAAKLESMTPD